MKVLSPDIQHITDEKFVYLGVDSIEKVKESFVKSLLMRKPIAQCKNRLNTYTIDGGRRIIGNNRYEKRDCQFGPVIIAGMAGIYLEVFKSL